MNTDDENSLFLMGEPEVTGRALATTTPEERQVFIRRHVSGDWSQTDRDLRAANTMAVLFEGAVRTYHEAALVTLLIITETERKTTRIMLPEEDR